LATRACAAHCSVIATSSLSSPNADRAIIFISSTLSEPTRGSEIGAENLGSGAFLPVIRSIGREADAEHFQGPVDGYMAFTGDDRRA
jgi:hypothetical protein